MQKIKAIFLVLFLGICSLTQGQIVLQTEDNFKMDYLNPKDYEIGGITFSGTAECDLRSLGLKVGDKIQIPGEQVRKAIDRLSSLGIYNDNIQIAASKIVGNTIFLDVYLEEAPRLKSFIYKGVKKSEIDDFEKKVGLSRGKVVNENLKTVVSNVIENFYRDKGFYNAQVTVTEVLDTFAPRFVTLVIEVNKNKKVKVNSINIYGTEEVDAMKLRSAMKETKTRFLFQPFEKWDTAFVDFFKRHEKYKNKSFGQLMLGFYADRVRVRFKASKYDPIKYESDKESLLRKYNELGYRDAFIVSDTMYVLPDNALQIDIQVNEGKRYYFRNINWVGNTKYDSELLGRVLQLQKGDVYNTTLLEQNLSMGQDNLDVSSLYLDDGYLFFYAIPVETAIVEDSVDIEIRIREGVQAMISKVSISGNTRTGDEVILRELATVPGRKFSRADIIRSQRQLLQLGFFNQEKLNVIPKPNEQTGTVELEYVVEEAPSDQLNLSLGWGGNMFYGSAGITFSNFSMRKFFKKGSWTPVPSGDGQKLSFSVQLYSKLQQQYSISFTEPWLGGVKPVALTVGAAFTLANGTLSSGEKTKLNILTLSMGFSNRLKWPDDYFFMSNTLLYQRYDVENYELFIVPTALSHGISYVFTLGRNSTDAVIYPRMGSDMSFSIQMTPPYSLFTGKDYTNMPAKEKYKFLEYHKWKFNISQFVNIYENLVLNVRAKFGYLGMYNKKVGIPPFERFYLGGSGLTSTMMLDSREIISMRGYADESIVPYAEGKAIGGSVFQKLTFELRYPITLNPSATVFLLTFMETGNCWADMKAYKPFEMYRSAGVGVRVFLPMFGLLGLDWGYGFDDIPGTTGKNRSQFHFSIGQSIE